MDEERSDASKAESGAPETVPAAAEVDDVDAQELLNAASRAIATVRRHAAELFRDKRHHDSKEGEQADAQPPSE